MSKPAMGVSLWGEAGRLSCGSVQIQEASSVLLPLQQRDDRHRVSVPELKILFQPRDDLSGLHVGAQLSAAQESSFLREFLEIRRALAGLGFDVVQVSLEAHMTHPSALANRQQRWQR